jgi:two-component system sensor histidine kinase MprB
MSFRRRMVLLAAGAVAAAIVLASAVVYVVTRNELRGHIDASLRQKLTPGQPHSVQIKETVPAAVPGHLPPQGIGVIAGGEGPGSGTTLSPPAASRGKQRVGEALLAERKIALAQRLAALGATPGAGVAAMNKLVLPAPVLGGAVGYVQLVQPNGALLRTQSEGSLLPITTATRAVAAGRRNAFFSDVKIGATPVRVLTKRAPGGGVWQAALPLTDLNSTLSHLRLVLAIVSLGGIALAAALGLLVSRAALVPVRRLTGAAERVARTQNLGQRIEVREEGELGRLSASFNGMLAALERSRLAQRRLVSDASHELRTPLTSVQANLDALALGDQLPRRECARILAAAQEQLRELTVLVGDLVDLSKTEVEEVEVEDVRLDLAVAGAIERAKLHAPGCQFSLVAEPCLVRAAPGRLDRAITNLLDNAVKWGPPAGPVEVRVHGGTVEVRDHGPGIAPQDLPRVFDRFYRASMARARPGSGLGLAIVRQTAEAHGGVVHAANDPGGGARLTLELVPQAMTARESAASGPADGAAARDAQEVPPVL